MNNLNKTLTLTFVAALCLGAAYALEKNIENTNQASVAVEKNPQSLRESLNKVLPDSTSKQEQINNVINASNSAEAIKAWQPVVDVLLKNYYVARDDLAGFQKIGKVINSLSYVIDHCVAQLQGNLKSDPQLAKDLIQLYFRVANYYSIANDFEQASAWLDKTEVYVKAEGLQQTENNSVYYNLRGGEWARQYQAGKLNNFPHESVENFEQALSIHQSLGNTLASNKHMRHVQMCLASNITQEAIWIVQTEQKVTPKVKAMIARAEKLLNELEPNLTNDPYRIAGVLQARSNISLLRGEFDEAIAQMHKAAAAMPPKDSGQLSGILNDYANVCVAKAAASLIRANNISAGKAENMYAEQATVGMEQIDQHPYAQLARIIEKQPKA